MDDHPIAGAFHLVVSFIIADHHTTVPKVVRERIRDFIIQKRQ
ncbi:Uncharacterised protein [Vibrio cholerae]|nr:Uncharacterised protein [Vibrio cholerae]CSC77379.1 Uncharacterised protein [Vibrio cholerae]